MYAQASHRAYYTLPEDAAVTDHVTVEDVTSVEVLVTRRSVSFNTSQSSEFAWFHFRLLCYLFGLSLLFR